MCAHIGGVRIKIGDFSRLTKVPVKTIRYYAETGLLTPRSVNVDNNYRYYSVEQLVELNRILAFKEAGFSLEEIKQLNKQQLSKEALLSLLESKLITAKNEHLLAEMRIHNLQARIKHIMCEEVYKMIDVTVKRIEPILVASIRKCGLTPDEHAAFYGLISTDVKAHGIKETGPWTCLRHDGKYRDGKMDWNYWADNDWEACVLIEKEYRSENPDIKIHYLPAVDQMACYIHKGEWGDTMKPTMEGFFEWLQLNGFEFLYPYREILHYGERESPDWSKFVTEVQFPIK